MNIYYHRTVLFLLISSFFFSPLLLSSWCCIYFFYRQTYKRIRRVVNTWLELHVAMLINEKTSHEKIEFFTRKNSFDRNKTYRKNEWKTCVEERQKRRMADINDVIEIELLLICRFVFFSTRNVCPCFFFGKLNEYIINEICFVCRWNELFHQLVDQQLVRFDVYLNWCLPLVVLRRKPIENRFSMHHHRTISMKCTNNGRKILNPCIK